MKHHKKKRTLGRDYRQRKALMRSLARSLVKAEKIKTTEAKAKELRPFVEKLVTKGKMKDLSSIRLINEKIGNKEASKKIVNVISPKYIDRNGGYTRITKLPQTKSNGRKEAVIEFV